VSEDVTFALENGGSVLFDSGATLKTEGAKVGRDGTEECAGHG
jgi:hypothetical protein